MRSFSILHLSDLHIYKYRNTYPNVLKKLIADISSETKNIESLILIVTGDIIDKADFENATDVAVSFFSDLSKALNEKISHIFFTPGNHDKKRVSCNEVLQKQFCEKRFQDFDDGFEKGDWKNLYSHAFDDYRELLKKISDTVGIKINSDLFYCDIFEINKCVIRINSLNSSISSFNDNDCGSLHIGKFQFNKIEQDFERQKKGYNDVDVSITIMHHPTYWLCKNEYDQIVYNISSLDDLSTDVLLRGHTHDRSLENHYTLYNSFSTLVTGIGENRESKDNEKLHNDHPQRYSIYTFMCDLNLIEINMRASSERGFIPDYSAYVNETDESRRKIHFPLRVHDILSNSFLHIPLARKDYQPIFPTKQILDEIFFNSKKLLYIKEELMNITINYKNQLVDVFKYNKESPDIITLVESQLLEKESNLTQEESQTVKAFLVKNNGIVCDKISGLLYEACCGIAKIFFEKDLSKEEKIRVQFRVYNCKNKSHEGLTNHTITYDTKIDDQPITVGKITPVKWGEGLIQPSFEAEEPLFFSINKNNIIEKRLEKTDWTDYFTYAPNIACNSYIIPRVKENIPAITFGISSNCDDCHLLFEILSLIPIKSLIDDFLIDISDSFKFSFESLVRNQ